MVTRNEWYLGAAIGSLLAFAVTSGIALLGMYAVLTLPAPSTMVAAITAAVSLYAFYRCSWKVVESHGSGQRIAG